MKTKEKILEGARSVLNEKGYGSTTVRHIAASIGISHGNLGYHFRNLDEIVKALYFQLVADMDQVMQKVPSQTSHLALLHEQSKYIFEQFERHKFFFLDFVAICKSIPDIKEHYLQLQKLREEQSMQIIHLMINDGLLDRKFSDHQYKQLIRQSTIQADFWLSSSEIHYTGAHNQKLTYYTDLFLGLWYPYLTDAGIEAYQEIRKKQGQ